MRNIIVGLATVAVAAVALFLLFIAPSGAPAPFERGAMLENIARTVIVPRHAELAEATARFEASAQAFAEEVTHDALARAQADWREAIVAWAGIELFGFGPLEIMVLHNRINKPSIDVDRIERYLQSGDIGPETLEQQGSPLTGLTVAEYLLFDVEGNGVVIDRFEDRPAHRDYLSALAHTVRARSEELLAFWSEDPARYAATFAAADDSGGSTRGSINMLVNAMIEVIEEIAGLELGPALSIMPEVIGFRPSAAQVPHGERSGTQLTRMRAKLLSVEHAYTGGEGLGLDDYLLFLGAETQAQLVRSRLDEALAAIDALEGPLEEAVDRQPDEVIDAYNAVRELLVATGVDAANQLGITVTFRDADGD